MNFDFKKFFFDVFYVLSLDNVKQITLMFIQHGLGHTIQKNQFFKHTADVDLSSQNINRVVVWLHEFPVDITKSNFLRAEVRQVSKVGNEVEPPDFVLQKIDFLSLFFVSHF